MNYCIENDWLRVEVSSLGGEILSVRTKDGTEFIWQGDARYWKKRAPHLFPFVGRLTDGSCTLEGVVCRMDTHGFFRWTEMTCIENTGDSIKLQMKSSQETYRQYPRQWEVELAYHLENAALHIVFSVTNRDDKKMYFGYGGHPGFEVPLEAGKKFEDYFIQFEPGCAPVSIGISDSCFVQGGQEPLTLDANGRLLLRHSLFDRDALILQNAGSSVTLQTEGDCHSVTVTYPQMPFLALWHPPKTDAPFVCIEPWTSLPSRQDVVEALEEKQDLICLESGGTYTNRWTISVSR